MLHCDKGWLVNKDRLCRARAIGGEHTKKVYNMDPAKMSPELIERIKSFLKEE